MRRYAKHLRFCIFNPMNADIGIDLRKRFNDSVFISPDLEYLFVKNEKAGNNTARLTLESAESNGTISRKFKTNRRWTGRLLQPSDLNIENISQLNELIPFKFCIVRNPYTRVLSCYKNKFEKNHVKKNRFIKKANVKGDINFKKFVEAIGKQDPYEMDPHWRTQYYNLFCGIIKFDRYIKFEYYEQEFSDVLSKFYSKIDFINVRKNETRAEESINKYYDTETADMIYNKFKIDFDTFGYEKI